MSFKEYLEELITEAKYDDDTTIDFFNSEKDIIKTILQDKKVKSHIGKSSIYFDGGDLVFGDKTVPAGKNILSSAGWDYKTSIGDLKASILKMPATNPIKNRDNKNIGDFNVTLIDDKRIIIDADDKIANDLKKKFHDSKSGVNVRIMKRSSGNKVYIDTKEANSMDILLKTLEKL